MNAGSARTFGIVAIVLGAMLVMGGTMFIAAALMGNFSHVLFISPGVQILLGFMAVIGGLMLFSGVGAAKIILIIVAMAVLLNMVLFAVTAFISVG
ncbi:MAG TPA: hypothetical protein VFE62_18825 [Gemmataceae bacterium]|nr:hypothetical protein [Gemmataceae bacterium]